MRKKYLEYYINLQIATEKRGVTKTQSLVLLIQGTWISKNREASLLKHCKYKQYGNNWIQLMK